ncbi:penicillin acylase family protein [Azospirillum sp. B4]|uniref:penicillin acylase family protein n=1 Tax=Azospirillum sp. B4 TaxID=95605 RepID=UPI00034B22A7|nr:penicillin acylase family protein [Azospirillum sp. B4]
MTLSRCLLAAAATVAMAITSACAVRTATPTHDITIKRDTYGVPHIYADTVRGLYHGYGYAVAEDRLYQMEMARRSGTGTVAAVLGPAYVAVDKATLSGVDPAAVRAQLAALPPEERDIFEGYADGINARIRDVLADRTHLMPREFITQDFEPTPWTAQDVAMVGIGLIFNRFFSGTAEVANLRLLNALVEAKGATAGRQIYDQLRWVEDPTAPTILDKPPTAAGTSASAGTADLAPLSLAPLSLAAADDYAEGQRQRMGLAAAQGMPTASNAWVLAPSKTAGGETVLVNGPQQGWYNPSLLVGIGLHGAGYDVVGRTPVGLPAVFFGTNGQIAWGSTVGSLDTNDIYQETLNPADPHQYLFRGTYRPMTRRVETIHVRGQPDQTVEIYTTVHGVVREWDPARNTAYSEKRAWEGYEVASLLGWTEAAKARDWDGFMAQAARVGVSITWFYADRAGTIGAAALGHMPKRPAGQDIQLPAKGDGGMEWDGLLPFNANPKQLNSAKGYFTSWNNQVVAGLRADGANYSEVDRANELISQLEAKPRLSLDDIWQIDERASYADVNARYFIPLIIAATRNLPTTDPVRQAADLLAGWDGQGRDPAGTGLYDSPALTLFRTWLPALFQRVFQDDLPPEVYKAHAGFGYPTLDAKTGSPGSVAPGRGAKLLWNALRGPRAGVPQRHDFLHGQDRDTLIRAGLRDAIDQLTARFGPDRSRWLTPVVPMRFSAINAAGVPWAPLEEQPLVAPYRNRGATTARVVMDGDGVRMCSTAAPGQSGFIAPDGGRSPHYADQLPLFRDFSCKRDWLSPQEVDDHLESRRTLPSIPANASGP